MSIPRPFTPILFLFLAACAPGIASPAPENPVASPNTRLEPTRPPEEPPPAGAAQEFETDFSKHSVPYSEILSGGPPKDGIPALMDPAFVSVSEADGWLNPVEPVILVQNGDATKAYPIQILMWHEIVNDSVGSEPLVVTFCPLCNTAIAFRRTFDGRVLDFGTTGRLRYSNLIMYDRQSENWWQQATGDAIAGEETGARLEFYPANIVSWQDFKDSFPKGSVLSRETGYPRNYGENPYSGYDDVNRPPFLYLGPETPGQLPPVARVLTLELKDETVAYPYTRLAEIGAVNDTAGGEPVTVFWQGGTASPLDGPTTNGRDVGTAATFSRRLDGRTLTFSWIDERIIDDQTGSEWNILGRSTKGELSGQQLSPILSVNHFWFSWAAFKPETRIYQP